MIFPKAGGERKGAVRLGSFEIGREDTDMGNVGDFALTAIHYGRIVI